LLLLVLRWHLFQQLLQFSRMLIRCRRRRCCCRRLLLLLQQPLPFLPLSLALLLRQQCVLLLLQLLHHSLPGWFQQIFHWSLIARETATCEPKATANTCIRVKKGGLSSPDINMWLPAFQAGSKTLLKESSLAKKLPPVQGHAR
jgi:hypothetical protein